MKTKIDYLKLYLDNNHIKCINVSDINNTNQIEDYINKYVQYIESCRYQDKPYNPIATHRGAFGSVKIFETGRFIRKKLIISEKNTIKSVAQELFLTLRFYKGANASIYLGAAEDLKNFDPIIYIVLNLRGKKDLFDIMHSRNSFSKIKAISIHSLISDILRCHDAGLAHCDIKPENILFCERDNTLELIDFGGSFIKINGIAKSFTAIYDLYTYHTKKQNNYKYHCC